MSILIAILLVVIGFILLIKGADFLVDSSSNIAKRFHIPEIIIGLTIVSIGTSLPELYISLSSVLDQHTDIALGNIIGSSICNLLLILGISATIRPLKVKRETRLIEIPMCLIFTIIFGMFCNTMAEISRVEAIALLGLFIMFILYTIVMAFKGEKFDSKDGDIEEENTENKSPKSMLQIVIYIILGIVGLKFGGDLVVNNALIIAEYFNLSEQIISLTIVAIGTSLPELVTSVVASIRGDSDISIGNILGSNIFNMTLITGISSLINPIPYNLAYNGQFIILIFATIMLLLFPLIPPKNKLSRRNGIIYLILYVIFSILLLK